MNLLILGSNIRGQYGSSSYRGTDRSWPSHIHTVNDDHPVNKAFLWFCREGGQEGVVHDLDKARHLVRLYREVTQTERLELIEVTQASDAPEVGQEFLGFDLSCGFCVSLLSGGLRLSRVVPHEHSNIVAMQPLLTLIENYFKPKLNRNGLFDEHQIASFCLACMLAMRKVHPTIWESHGSAEFEVTGVYLVPS